MNLCFNVFSASTSQSNKCFLTGVLISCSLIALTATGSLSWFLKPNNKKRKYQSIQGQWLLAQ